MMKNTCFVLLLLIGPMVLAQNEIHQKAVDTFILDFNNGDFEHIYQTFSPEMKKRRSKKYYLGFFQKVKTNAGKILQLELLDYLEKPGQSRATYNGSFEYNSATVWIVTNEQGQIIGMYIKKNTLL